MIVEEKPFDLRQPPTLFKVPPHAIEAEQAVLGGLMLENLAWDRVADKLTEQDFYRTEHRIIFRVIAILIANGKPLDVITLSEQLEQKKELDSVGGLSYLGNLAKNTPSAANIAAYAEIVRERSILRQLAGVGSGLSESAFEPKGRLATEILDEAEQKIFAIAEQNTKSGQGPVAISEVFAHTLEKVETLFRLKSPITGMPSGFRDFDELTAGLQPSDLIIIAGRPSMGKTMFAMNIAEYVAMKEDKPVLVFSMEMPAESLAMRLLSSLARIEQQKIRTGQFKESDWPRLTQAIGLISEKKLFIDDAGALTPTDVRARARRLAREYNGIGMIIVDYLQLMRSPGHYDNRAAEIAEISRSLKLLARELSVPVVALSQLNRGLEQRFEKRPVMSDLRESGAIEQDADLIAFLYRDEVYNKESADKGIAEIIIAKQRNGPIGTVRLTCLGQYSRFENYTAQMPHIA